MLSHYNWQQTIVILAGNSGMKSLYDWDYKWLGSQPTKPTMDSANLHYFAAKEKQGYRKINCQVTDGDSAPVKLALFYKINQSAPKRPVKRQTDKPQVPIDFCLPQNKLEEKKEVQFSTNLISQSVWVDKYLPRKYDQLLSEEIHNKLVLFWAKKWDRIVFRNDEKKMKALNSSNRNPFGRYNLLETEDSTKDQNQNQELDEKRLILLSGPPGCGKTTLARIVATKCDYNYAEINASDNRSAKNVIKAIDDMTNNQNMSGKPTFIIIDEVDGFLQSESNGIKSILNYIEFGEIPDVERTKTNKPKSSKARPLHIKRPVIFICNDPFVKGLKQLRRRAYTVYMKRISTQKMVERLKHICDLESIRIQREALEKISNLNDNDIRASLAMLEFISKTVDFRKKPTVKIIDSIQWDVRNSAKSSVDFVQRLMLHKNITKNLDFHTLNIRLQDVENPAAVTLQTLFSNLHRSNTVHRHSSKIPELLDLIAKSDVAINKSFGHQGIMGAFFAIPYYYFKQHFKAEDNQTRVDFPLAFFQGVSKQREHRRKLKNLYMGLHNTIKPFHTISHISHYLLLPLFVCIQSTQNAQSELIKCLKLMISYGVSFTNYQEEMYDPPIQSMLTIGKNKPEVVLSSVGRTLMKNNFKTVKDTLESSSLGTSPPEWKVSSALKKRKGQGGQGIEYKFCDGTGTQITYPLNMSYFK